MSDEQKRELEHCHKLLDEKLELLHHREEELTLLEAETLRLLHSQIMVSGVMFLSILALFVVAFALV